VSAAPVPAAIIDAGMAAPRLLAWVTVSKFVDHLPLYRLESIAQRSEVPLPRSTQAEWIELASRGQVLQTRTGIVHSGFRDIRLQDLTPRADKMR